MRATLNRFMANRSIRYEAEEGDLPRVVSIVKNVAMPKGADEFYQEARQQIIAARGNFREMKNAFLRMRQVSSGFVGYADDELGVRAQYELKPNPKLDQLLSLIEGVQGAHKTVVFHEFTFSGSIIERELEKLGIGFARLYGGTKNPEAELKRFHDDKNCRVFILQNASGGFGLDRLKVAKYGIYYEAPVGTITRQQTWRRVQRQGSEHGTVFMYDLVVPGTVDQQLLNAHAAGIDLFKSVMRGDVKL
jgi:SNF2 family DNA or RNA helicase